MFWKRSNRAQRLSRCEQKLDNVYESLCRVDDEELVEVKAQLAALHNAVHALLDVGDIHQQLNGEMKATRLRKQE